MQLIEWILVFFGIIVSSVGSIFLKIGSKKIDYEEGLVYAIIGALRCWELYLGIIGYFLSLVIWIYLLKKIDLSYLQPIFSLIYLITPIFAFFFLKENISLLRIIGIFIITIGVVIVAKS